MNDYAMKMVACPHAVLILVGCDNLGVVEVVSAHLEISSDDDLAVEMGIADPVATSLDCVDHGSGMVVLSVWSHLENAGPEAAYEEVSSAFAEMFLDYDSADPACSCRLLAYQVVVGHPFRKLSFEFRGSQLLVELGARLGNGQGMSSHCPPVRLLDELAALE